LAVFFSKVRLGGVALTMEEEKEKEMRGL